MKIKVTLEIDVKTIYKDDKYFLDSEGLEKNPNLGEVEKLSEEDVLKSLRELDFPIGEDISGDLDYKIINSSFEVLSLDSHQALK